MLLFVLDPIFQRIYSALFLLLAIRLTDLNQLGIYSWMVVVLSGFQTVLDTNLRTFFLNKSSIGSKIGIQLKKYRIYYLIPSFLLSILTLFEIVSHNASLQFLLFVFVPFSWIFTQEIHIRALRGSTFLMRYLKTRLLVTLLMNALGLVLFWKTKQIIVLIGVQGFIEIAIWSLMKEELRVEESVKQELEGDKQSKRALRNFTLISLSSWVIALWERFIVGFLIIPSDFAKWSIMSVAFRGPIEALGTGISSWLRATFAKLSNADGNAINIALRLNFLGCTVFLVASKFWIYRIAQEVFPLLVGYENLCLILILSAQVSVSYWILNSQNIFQSEYKSNKIWASLVFITSPLTAICMSRSLFLGCIIVLARDLLLIFNKRITKFPPKFGKAFLALVSAQILLIIL